MDVRLQIPFTGALVNGALYLAGCFVVGLVTDNGAAWRLALVAAGVTYLSYLAQTPRLHFRDETDVTPRVSYAPMQLRYGLFGLSVVVGALAGLALVMR